MSTYQQLEALQAELEIRTQELHWSRDRTPPEWKESITARLEEAYRWLFRVRELKHEVWTNEALARENRDE